MTRGPQVYNAPKIETQISRIIAEKNVATYTGRMFDVDYSNDGHTLFSSSEDEPISAWNLHTYQLDYSLTGHGKWVYPLAVLPERTQVACGDFDGEVRI